MITLEINTILEVVGAIFSILGAWYMSYAKREYLYKAFLFFLISNSSLLIFFILNGKVPMIIQFIFFFGSAILGMIRMSEDKVKTIKIFKIMFLISIVPLVFALLNIKEITFEVKVLDTIASSLAILGAFLLSSSTYIKRNTAYVMFVVADVIFVYIGFTNSFYFFMLQSLFFIYTGSRGLFLNISQNR